MKIRIASIFRYILLISVVVLMIACGGSGGGGDDDDDSAGNGNNNSGGADSNATVQEVLEDLGIDTSTTDRVDVDGDALPENHAPLGSNATVNKFSEILLFSVPIEDDDELVGGSGEMAITNLVPGANNSYSWELIDDEPLANTPWTDLGLKRATDAVDIDEDGIEEIVIIFQDSGNVELVVKQDADENFSVSDSIDVDNGSYERLFLTAGDFDGDGDQDLMLGLVSATGDATLKMLANSNGNLAFNGLSISIDQATYSIKQLVLASGNLDYDNALELAVMVNSGSVTSSSNSLALVEHRYYVYDDANTGFNELLTDQIEVDNGTGTTIAVSGNIALGDVDGDSIDEVVLAGLNQAGGVSSSNPYSSFKYMIEVRDDAKRDFSELAEAFEDVLLDGENFKPTSSGASHRLNYVLLVTADVEGDGADEILVNQHLYQSMRSSPGALVAYNDGSEDAKIPSTHFFTDGGSGKQINFNWQVVSVAAGDVTQDGRDNIVLYTQRDWTGQSPQEQQLTVWSHDQIDGWSLIASYDNDLSGTGNLSQHYFPQLHVLDIELDDGTAALQYSSGSHDLVFTEPLIIAALAGAPCATDLGQDLTQSCRTAYGNAVSDSTVTTNSTSVTGSIYAGFGVDDPVTSNSLEVVASIKKTINSWDSNGYTLKKTLLYETGAIEDSVILTVLPMDVYTYTILSHPDPTLVGEEVVVSLPREPITTLVTLDYYNLIVDSDNLKIESDIFAHTPGDPESYPTSGEKNSLLNRYDGIETTEVFVGVGTGQTVATISSFTTTTKGKSYEKEYSLDVRATGGLFGGYVLGGFSVGYNKSSTLEVSHGEETIYQGAVGNIDEDSFDAGLDYQWGLFTYLYDDHSSGQDFEILNYWVD